MYLCVPREMPVCPRILHAHELEAYLFGTRAAMANAIKSNLSNTSCRCLQLALLTMWAACV